MPVSPVQTFSALAAATGDMATAFAQSGLHAALNKAFEFEHTQVWRGPFESYEERGSLRPPPPSGLFTWHHLSDQLYYVDPLGIGHNDLACLSRSAARNGEKEWRFNLDYRPDNPPRHESCPFECTFRPVLTFSGIVGSSGQPSDVEMVVHEGQNLPNQFSGVALLDRVLQAAGMPKFRLPFSYFLTPKA